MDGWMDEWMELSTTGRDGDGEEDARERMTD